MTGLPCEIEQIILALDQISHRKRIAYITDIQRHLIFDVCYVVQITPIQRDQAVNQSYFRTHLHQAPSQIRADESDAACDQCFLAMQVLIFNHL